MIEMSDVTGDSTFEALRRSAHMESAGGRDRYVGISLTWTY